MEMTTPSNDKEEYETVEEEVDGRRIVFEGNMRGFSTDCNPTSWTRRNDVTVYKKKNSGYVVIWEFLSRYQGERNKREYKVFENLENLQEHAEDDILLRDALVDASLEKKIVL